MADESNATLNDIAGLLRLQVERADELAAREKERHKKDGALRMRLSRLLALILVTLCAARIFHSFDARALAGLANVSPSDLFEQQRKLHQHSYAWLFTGLLIAGGLYFFIVEGIASLIRRAMPKG